LWETLTPGDQTTVESLIAAAQAFGRCGWFMIAHHTAFGGRALSWLQRLDRVLDLVCAAGAVLALPVSALLFLQWPLREWIQAYSREANDLAQICFALYVSVAVTYASRRHTHLGTDMLARHYSPRLRRLVHRAATAVAVLPWAGFVMWSSATTTLASVTALESFPETFNPGYFLIKIAMALLALLAMLQALLSSFGVDRKANV
jgi:TRAP-type C4-dicarboxylate transport system permease small subunit